MEEIDPYFSDFFMKKETSYIYQDPDTNRYTEMECTNYVDVSHKYSYRPFVPGWGRTEPSSDNIDITEDDEVEDLIKSVKN